MGTPINNTARKADSFFKGRKLARQGKFCLIGQIRFFRTKQQSKSSK